MARQERVHEGLEIGAPPLRKSVADLPGFVDTFAGELGADGGETLVQTLLESVDLFVLEVEVVAGPVH